MYQSKLFIPTLRDDPKEAEVVSHRILLRGGYIKLLASGVYTYLPLGYKIIKNIEEIVREELDKIGCSELLMPTLQPKDLWDESGRWDKYGKELMRIKDRNDRYFCLGPTHEEVITSIIRDHINSYKKLPVALYQIQSKFRDEFRPRYGLMRGREFIMKDLYSFSATYEDLDEWYQKVRRAYQNILDRLQLNYRIVKADSGNIGGDCSEEFMVLCDIGEDVIAYSDTGTFATNVEVGDYLEGSPSPCGVGVIKHAKGIEAGHIFKLGEKYSSALKANFIDKDGKTKPIIMGCYGIGISRLLMVILEQTFNGQLAVWPKSVRPFDVHLLALEKDQSLAINLYEELIKLGYKVLLDDRLESPGVKFKDSDLIGIENRIIVGRNSVNGIYEYKNILTNESREVDLEEILRMEF